MTFSYVYFLNEVHPRNWLWSKCKSSSLLCPPPSKEKSKIQNITIMLVLLPTPQVESPDDALVSCGVLFWGGVCLCVFFLKGDSDCAEQRGK